MDLQTIIAEIERLKRELAALRPLTDEAELRFRQKISLDWTFNSNAIEGNRLTFGETKTFIKHGITAAGKPFRDYIDVRGHTEAVKAVFELSEGGRPLTEALIRQLHEITLVEPYRTPAQSLSGQRTTKLIELGKYKTQPNHVQTSTGETHFYASPEETPAKMGDLMTWYRAELAKTGDDALHPLLIASTFHYKFVAIHPFDDGNGRMARLLMNYILLSFDYPPAIIPNDKKAEYLTVLEVADTGDLEPFILFVGSELFHSFDMYIRAANGETIEAYDDIDKKLSLLQLQIKAKKDEEVGQQQKALSVISQFMAELFQQLEKFSPFFESTKIAMVESIKAPYQPSPYQNVPFDSAMEVFEEYTGASNLETFGVRVTWLRFQLMKEYKLELNIQGDLESSGFKIGYSLFPEKPGQRTPTKQLVGETDPLIIQSEPRRLSVEEVEKFVSIITSEIYVEIESLS